MTELTDNIVGCSCCGRSIPDNAEHNVSFGVIPSPHDAGFGMCRRCGGDDTVPTVDVNEATIKRSMGWAMVSFCEARFPILRKNLKPANQLLFDTWPFTKKCLFVQRAVLKGWII